MKEIFCILMLSFFLCSCATLEEKMLKQTHSGYPRATEALLLQEYQHMKDSNFQELKFLCLSYIVTYDFEKQRECLDILKSKIDGNKINHQIAYNQSATFNLEYGNYKQVSKDLKKALELGPLFLGVLNWEVEAISILNQKRTKEGDARVEELIKMIDEFRIKILFGLITVGEEFVSKMRASSIARIRLRQNKVDLARMKLQETLDGKHISEVLLEGTLNYFQNPVEKTFEAIVSSLDVKHKKDMEDMKYLTSMLEYQLLATLSIKDLRYDDAIQGYRRILDDKRVYSHNFYYIPSLFYLSLAYLEKGEMSSSNSFWKAYVNEIKKIPSPYREGIINKYRNRLNDEFMDLKFRKENQFCKRWNKSFSKNRLKCNFQ